MSYNLEAIESRRMKEMKNSTRTRQQSGHFHVYFRGNNKFAVFYNEADYIVFLQKFNLVAKEYNTKTCAFALMDNHVHLHLITEDLTEMMRAFLIQYSRWYNKSKGINGKLFSTPFSSSPIYSSLLVEDNLLYILSNPIKSYICTNPEEYKWSSYHFYFTNKRNPLSQFIDIDTTIVENIFGNRKALDNAILSYNADITENKGSYWSFTPDFEIIKHMNSILNGRNLYSLDKDEMMFLLLSLRKDKGATFRQIASITHGSYDEIRRLFCHPK